jgi:hypothetical protein
LSIGNRPSVRYSCSVSAHQSHHREASAGVGEVG